MSVQQHLEVDAVCKNVLASSKIRLDEAEERWSKIELDEVDECRRLEEDAKKQAKLLSNQPSVERCQEQVEVVDDKRICQSSLDTVKEESFESLVLCYPGVNLGFNKNHGCSGVLDTSLCGENKNGSRIENGEQTMEFSRMQSSEGELSSVGVTASTQ